MTAIFWAHLSTFVRAQIDPGAVSSSCRQEAHDYCISELNDDEDGLRFSITCLSDMYVVTTKSDRFGLYLGDPKRVDHRGPFA